MLVTAAVARANLAVTHPSRIEGQQNRPIETCIAKIRKKVIQAHCTQRIRDLNNKLTVIG